MVRSYQSDYGGRSFTKQCPEYNFNTECRIDFYVVEALTGRSSHPGESFPFYPDFGADCSLIKESVVLRISGKRTIDIVVMRGIRNIGTKRIAQILSVAGVGG